MASRKLHSAASALVLIAGFAVIPSCEGGEPAATEKTGILPAPYAYADNLLLVMVDTLRADHLGLYGYEQHPTSPNLDALATRSTVFDQAYSHAPWTLPSIATIMTSLQPRDHGVLKLTHTLLPDYRTLAETLRDHGFHTMAVVSHLILEPEYGFDQGFDHYDRSILDQGHPHRVTSSELVTDKLIAALDARSDGKPWFAWAHYFDPHDGYFEHAGFEFGDEPMARYDSEIAFTDHHIGRLLRYLEERGMLENTVVAFVSDHGEEFRDHGRSGHTVTLYEELIRVPLMIFVPDLAANRVPAVVASLDLGPTLLALLGLRPPDEFRGEAIRIEDGAFAAPIDRVVFSETRRMQQLRGVRQGEWKFVRDLRRQTDELFHLPSDPLERTDLSESEVERRRELRGRLREHYQTPTKRIDERRLSEKTKKLLEKLGYLE